MIYKVIEWFRTFWFWVISSIFLFFFFLRAGNSATQIFYFLSSLLPIVIGTSIFVNEKLIPNYLIPKRYNYFFLYSIYTLIISLYLQYLVIFIALLVFGFYDRGTFDLSNLNVSSLNLSLYLLIILSAFIHLFGIYSNEQIQSKKDEEFENEETQIITVRHNRKNYPVTVSDIHFIESLSDYIKIVQDDQVITTKERISNFHEMLPSSFIRIHRSFIVNKSKIKSYTKEYVSIGETNLPISRTYKEETMKSLNTNS